MSTLLIAVGAGLAFIIAYHTYGRWLGRRIFNLSADYVCPSHRLRDDNDYVPTPTPVVFGHHFTSIAGTGPIVGPAIAVMWGWLPALLWVVFGSIFIGAVHDFGALVVSLRNNGQTVGEIAGRVLNRRVRLLFLLVLFLALLIVIAIFGLVIAAVFRQYPAAIFPCMVQIPIAVAIGLWLHRKGVNLLLPSLIALAVMYLTVIWGDWGPLHTINTWLASLSTITWVAILLVYSGIASVIPVWALLQPRDYINSLQLISALGLIVLGLVGAAIWGGAPPVEGADRVPLEVVAPMWNPDPAGAPLIFPFLFITIACGAISGFHCLVSSGTSSKQLNTEPDARFVGYGGMLTEGFLATLVILACVAGLGLGIPLHFASNSQFYGAEVSSVRTAEGDHYYLAQRSGMAGPWVYGEDGQSFALAERPDFWRSMGVEMVTQTSVRGPDGDGRLWEEIEVQSAAATGGAAFATRYTSWTAAGSLGAKVSAFVDGAANLLKAIGVPGGVAVALMGVLVASFAGTTLDTACRLQRYVVQELAVTFAPRGSALACRACGYDMRGNVSGACPECGGTETTSEARHVHAGLSGILANRYVATAIAVVTGGLMATMPAPGASLSWATAGTGGLILWPMFGATNQLLGGLAFLVIAFYLWRRRKPVWFLVLPMVFMLIMPAWAMLMELPGWLDPNQGGGINWPLIAIALATLGLEAWMLIEALLLWPRVKGLLEEPLPGGVPDPATVV